MSDAVPPTDPFALMRQAYDEAVETWAKTMEQVVSTEEFASASGQYLKRYVELQESIRTASQATAESLHIPTTDDLARVAQLVVNVERKVDEVSDEAHAIAGLLERLPADGLTAIVDRLASIEAKLDTLARPVAAPVSGSSAGPPAEDKASATKKKAAAPKRPPTRRRAQAPKEG